MTPHDPRQHRDRIPAPPGAAAPSPAVRPGPPPLPATTSARPQAAVSSSGGGRAAAPSQADAIGLPVVPLVIIAASVALLAIGGLAFSLAGGAGRPAEVASQGDRPADPAPSPPKETPAREQTPAPAPRPADEPALAPTPAAPPAAAWTPLTPGERWKALQANLAKPAGRYPLDSLDGENPEAQTAKICEVGDVEFDLVLPTDIFTPGSDAWQFACSRPDKAKREWVIECVSWPQGQPQSKKPNALGTARVEDDGWLVVALEKLEAGQYLRAAREALTCGPLTLKTPIHPNGGADMEETWVQLRRPAEYGPIVIEKFFGNKLIWPKGKVKDGKWPPSEFAPIPGVAVPANPWVFRMMAGKSDVVLAGAGDRKPQAGGITSQDGSFDAVGRPSPSASQIRWQASFSREPTPIDFLRTDVEFQRLNDGVDGSVLGVRIENAEIESWNINYELLAHLNKAPALNYREAGADRLDADEFFPITKKVVEDFRKSQLEAVAYATISRFVQAWLPLEKFPTDAIRIKLMTEQFGARERPKPMPLEEWPEPLRNFLASHPLYEEWCFPPGKPPVQPPPDEKQKQAWEEKKRKWDAVRQALLTERRTKTAEFAAWLNHQKSPEDEKVVAALQAVCTAIEKLPAVETGKRETVALLESMETADLQISGALVVWPASEPGKQCVLATFTAGRTPVVLNASEVAKRASSDVQTPPDAAGPFDKPFQATGP